MSEHRVFRNSDPSVIETETMPKDMYRAEFARRLNRAMVRKGWNQSELARNAAHYTPKEAKGVSRDLISKYIGGKVVPSPVNLQILVDTLGVKREDLVPAGVTAEAGESIPPVDVRDAGNGMVWLRVNQLIEWPKALKILAILKGEEE